MIVIYKKKKEFHNNKIMRIKKIIVIYKKKRVIETLNSIKIKKVIKIIKKRFIKILLKNKIKKV